MGVEYRHFLVVNDPDWRPQADTAARVEAVLRAWDLVERLERVVDLSDGRGREVPAQMPTTDPGPGLALHYGGMVGASVEKIAGPSYHDADTEDRYTMEMWLVVGNDYRVQWSSEDVFFEVMQSPTTAEGEPIAPLDQCDVSGMSDLFDDSFLSADAATPPVVKAQVEERAQGYIGWEDFQGFWRGALMINFGKDLPSFVERKQRLPATAFVAAIAAAFRGPVVEIGEIY